MPEVEYQVCLTEQQKQTLLDIWNAEYPQQLCMPGMAEFNAYLSTLINPRYLLLKIGKGEFIGWAASFTRDGMRCFLIMLKSKAQGKGYGALLINALKGKEDALFGWAVDHDRYLKIDGTPYASPLYFYQKNGFTINNKLRLETGILSAVGVSWQGRC